MMRAGKKGLRNRIIANLLVAIIVVAAAVGLCSFYVNSQKNIYYSNAVMTATSISYNNSLKKQELESDDFFMTQLRDFYSLIALEYLQQNKFTPEAFTQAEMSSGQDMLLFFITNDGDVKCDEHMDQSFYLPQSTIKELESATVVENEDGTYTSLRSTEGKLVTFWAPDYDSESSAWDTLFMNKPGYMGENHLIVRESVSETIVTSSDRDMSGEILSTFDWNLSTFVQGDFVFQRGREKIDGEDCLILAMKMDDAYDIILYTPYNEYFIKHARDCVLPPVLLLLAALCIGIFVNVMVSRRLHERTYGEAYGRGKTLLDKSVLAHLNVFIALSMIVVMGVTAYFQVLTSFSNLNRESTKMLDSLAESITQNEESIESIRDRYYKDYANVAEYLAWLLAENPEVLESDSLSKLMAAASRVEEISVFDGAGDSVASTRFKHVYPLSKDKSDPDYACRALLETSNKYYVAVAADEEGETLYIAVRRVDAPGVVRLTVDPVDIRVTEDVFSISSAILANSEASVADGAIFAYLSLNDEDTLYWYEDDEITEEGNTLPKEFLKDEYSGQNRISGKTYYVNTEKTGKYILLSMVPNQNITGQFLPMLGVEAAAFLLIFLVYARLVLPFAAVAESEEEEERRQSPENFDVLDDLLKKSIGVYLAVTMTGLLLILWVDSILSKDSLLSYVYGMEWKKGYNLYSLTAILLTTTITIIIALVLTRAVKISFSRMGNRLTATGQLIRSLIKIIAVMVIVFFGLYQIGMDPTAMLASAGITSLVFAYGVKDVVNDLVYGLLHMSEGVVKVGDLVSINGTEGKVLEVGFRQIVIETKNERKTYRNSKINDIARLEKFSEKYEKADKKEKNSDKKQESANNAVTTNAVEKPVEASVNRENSVKNEKNGRMVHVVKDFRFSVDRTDVSAVVKLLEEHAADLGAKLSGCVESPVCEGITGFEPNGVVTVSVCAVIDRSETEYEQRQVAELAERKLANEVISLCLANGIKL